MAFSICNCSQRLGMFTHNHARSLILIHFKSYAHKYAHKYPKRLYIWNGALYNKRELLRHAAQAACPSEKQMLDSVLHGNTVFFLRAPRQSIHGQERDGSRRAAVRRRYGWARQFNVGPDGRGTDRRRIFKP